MPHSRFLPVERGLEVDPWTKSIHAHEHLSEKEAEENILGYFKKLREPLWLVVMLHSDTAGVEKDKENHKPVEPLLLHNAPDHKPEKIVNVVVIIL